MSPTRSEAISITNSSIDRDQEVWIEFEYGYQTINKKGDYTVVSQTEPAMSEPSCTSWLRAYPQRFVLSPGGAQKVRITAAPPSNVLDGEYWARIKISSKLSNPRIRPGTSPSKITTGIEIVERADIPFHYRRGTLTTGLSLSDVTTEKVGDSLKVLIGLIRTGNASYWGNLTCRLKDNTGKNVSLFKDGIAVYKNQVLPVNLRVTNVPSGTYTLEINITTEGGGLPKDYVIKAEPVRYSAAVDIP